MLPTLAAAWIAHQRSANTQKTYGRGFRIFEEFAREYEAHPMAVTFPLTDTFRLHLETAPTWQRVKGGARGEMARTGKPYSDASRANAQSSASSFFAYRPRKPTQTFDAQSGGGKTLRKAIGGSAVTSLDFSPGNSRLAVAYGHHFVLWKLA